MEKRRPSSLTQPTMTLMPLITSYITLWRKVGIQGSVLLNLSSECHRCPPICSVGILLSFLECCCRVTSNKNMTLLCFTNYPGLHTSVVSLCSSRNPDNGELVGKTQKSNVQSGVPFEGIKCSRMCMARERGRWP